MLPSDNGNALEGGHLRSGRRFRSGKRRRTVTRRGSCSMTRGEDYELTLTLMEVLATKKRNTSLSMKGKNKKKP